MAGTAIKALLITHACRGMHGDKGVSGKYGAICQLMNFKAVHTYEGAHDIHTRILGRGQTGLPALN